MVNYRPESPQESGLIDCVCSAFIKVSRRSPNSALTRFRLVVPGSSGVMIPTSTLFHCQISRLPLQRDATVNMTPDFLMRLGHIASSFWNTANSL
jgi:hypothetical protein